MVMIVDCANQLLLQRQLKDLGFELVQITEIYK